MFRKLWQDEGGTVVSAELILIGTVLVIGLITGMSSLRDAVITELADVGAAIAKLDQSYVLHGSSACSSATASTEYDDVVDYCDEPGISDAERGLVICSGVFASQPSGSEQP